MGKASTNILFLAVGAAIGAAVTYIATSDHRDEWLHEAGKLVRKIKDGFVDDEEELEDLIEDEE
ncbi:YtxH domain-containing protein [Dysgonomonas sp. 520]|uniref:YtxH domain-containing protein n=1 Tax=Dysgonomonas sp. 520 TaxID=2302931 RepID=UPI0013D5A112|nr:YtxH domain-containing protein [Dysgonomonas sp. 520]NDW09923.1 YtxH domain-containing protein [Dysgonomonas sp. 520]